MNKVNELAKILGIEVNEQFVVKDDDADKISFNPFKLTNDGCFVDRDNDVSNDVLANLITGEYTIEKLPFKPKNGQKYFYIAYNGVISSTANSVMTTDISLIAMGNCFRTEMDAENHKDEMLKKLNEVIEGCK